MNNFFTIKSIENLKDGNLLSKIKLNPSHKIFSGHFPNNPIVPGVMTIQMIKKILSDNINKKLMLTKGNNIKFTAPISPNIYQEINAKINFIIIADNNLKVKAQVFYGEIIFLKFSGIFKITS